MERCIFCQGDLVPGTRRCRWCGRAQPEGTTSAPLAQPSEALRVRCPRCGQALPAHARFCANCGLSFAGPSGGGGVVPPSGPIEAPGGAPGFGGAPAGPQGGYPGLPHAPAGPQGGYPGVPHASAWPQGGAPGVPHAPAGPQGGYPGVPHAPAGPQSGALSSPGSAALRVAGKGVARGLRYKLLGTATAKIVTTVVVAAVVATSVAVVAVAKHTNTATSALPTPTSPPLGTLFTTYTGHSMGVTTVSWSPDGTRIVSGSYDSTAQVWDATTGRHLLTYNKQLSPLNVVAWSPDGKKIASGGGDYTVTADQADNSVQIWNPSTGQTLRTYHGHDAAVGGVTSLAWSPDSTRIASGDTDGSLQVWDAATGILVFKQDFPNASIYDVAWSPDGRRIAVTVNGGFPGSVVVLDASTGKTVSSYKVRSGSSLVGDAWSPDGKMIASAEGLIDTSTPLPIVSYTKIDLWNPASGQTILSYAAPAPLSGAPVWSPNGKRLAAPGAQNTVVVWDAQTRGILYTFRQHKVPVVALAWSPDGTRIVSAANYDLVVGDGGGGLAPNANDSVIVWEAG